MRYGVKGIKKQKDGNSVKKKNVLSHISKSMKVGL